MHQQLSEKIFAGIIMKLQLSLSSLSLLIDLLWILNDEKINTYSVKLPNFTTSKWLFFQQSIKIWYGVIYTESESDQKCQNLDVVGRNWFIDYDNMNFWLSKVRWRKIHSIHLIFISGNYQTINLVSNSNQ